MIGEKMDCLGGVVREIIGNNTRVGVGDLFEKDQATIIGRSAHEWPNQ